MSIWRTAFFSTLGGTFWLVLLPRGLWRESLVALKEVLTGVESLVGLGDEVLGVLKNGEESFGLPFITSN